MTYSARSLMLLVVVMSNCGISLIYSPLVSAEIDRGQALYENHCKFCHDSWVHTRTGRKVTSIPDLQQRVKSWSIHSGLDWNKEDIDDVAGYLNREFYQLEETSDR